jgi:hypothetical protein
MNFGWQEDSYFGEPISFIPRTLRLSTYISASDAVSGSVIAAMVNPIKANCFTLDGLDEWLLTVFSHDGTI